MTYIISIKFYVKENLGRGRVAFKKKERDLE